MAGYSGTPLARKLGIKEGTRLFLADAPPNYPELVAPLPNGVQMATRMDRDVDIAHLFFIEKAHLIEALQDAPATLRPDAAIWVSWPKKSSKVVTDITEDTVREVALPMGLVDIKVCAIDETWSALKLVVRKANRRPQSGA